MMRVLLLHFNFSLLLVISALAQNELRVTVEVEGIQDRTVYLKQDHAELGRIVVDSVLVKSNRVEFTAEIAEPNLYVLEVDSVPGFLTFIWDNDIQIVGHTDSLWRSIISGSDETKLWQDYQRKYADPARYKLIDLTPVMHKAIADKDLVLLEKITEDQHEILKEVQKNSFAFIEGHPDSFVSLSLLRHHADNVALDTTKSALRLLAPHWQGHSVYQYLSEWAAHKTSVLPGEPAPAFSAATFEGEPISLDNFRGNYVILDFWGTWCEPCVKKMPQMNQLRQSYPKDQLEMLFFNRDRDVDAFSKALKKYDIGWGHHFFTNKDLIRRYGAGAIPKLYLISPEGKILYNDDDQEAGNAELKILSELLASRLNSK
ncbi:MAG: TlpA disulfide reductase family protein [Bacteroidota bacterium]